MDHSSLSFTSTVIVPQCFTNSSVTDDVLLLPRAGLEFLESKKMTGLTDIKLISQ